ncbi:MAG: endolytic transglycosylase MltG [Candidatus Sumerlaeia bacterium]|nr:endolytic transglycosylase MltG [Candidatus Sumerlaeia bacterium]
METLLQQNVSPPVLPPPKRTLRRLVMGLLCVLFVLICLSLVGAVWFRHCLKSPVSKRPFEAVVVVKRGASYHTIKESLHTAGLLPYPLVFDYLAWRGRATDHLKPGRYHFHSSHSPEQIYEALTRGAPVRITVPEGWTVRQIAARLAAEDLVATADEFSSAACNPAFLARYGIAGPTAEGYLLPETYLFDPGVSPAEILDKMAAAFAREYAAEAARPRPDSLTWHQIVTLASMIERETANDAEKPLIASVYYNRLRRGMTLNCDATLCYWLDKWHEPLTMVDLKKDFPYNTYLHKGLPPGPIACIGRKSLEAALSPATTDYLYYCQRDGNSHVFSKTYAEHEAAVRKYIRKDLTETDKKK